MTREEEIRQAQVAIYGTEHCRAAEHFEQGASWADKTMLDRACEWLENYLKPLPHELDEFINERNLIIERFRKAMEQWDGTGQTPQ